ncbi:MAG: hypothetical protein LBR35_00380, partial [Rickettsiales bacterium]|nr:hypothetical protein [Rickettsiales bacterium]
EIQKIKQDFEKYIGHEDTSEYTYEILVKKDKKIIDNYYYKRPDIIYKSSDGCHFYFKKYN